MASARPAHCRRPLSVSTRRECCAVSALRRMRLLNCKPHKLSDWWRTAMDFSFSDEQVMLRETVRKLMDEHAPLKYLRRLDREQTYPSELYQEWVKAGFLSIPFPEAYGGLGGSVLDVVIIAEELSRRSADLVMAYAGSVFCGLNIFRKGSEEQKRYWLPKLLSGEIKMSISISEPDAGS